MSVTPEEVILELGAFLKSIEPWPEDDTFRLELDREAVNAILEAIRNAENDTLERAAVIAEAADETVETYTALGASIARRLRDMKATPVNNPKK